MQLEYERRAAQEAQDAHDAEDGVAAMTGRERPRAGRTATSGGWGTAPPRDVLDLLPHDGPVGLN